MDDKERVRLVLQHVMGYFVLEATATGYHTPEFSRGTSVSVGFHWPIAFWNTDAECWMIRDIATGPTIFDPLYDLNDAVQVIRRFTVPVMLEWRGHSFMCKIAAVFAKDEPSYGLSDNPAEAVCIAALRAVGIEIGD